MNKRLEELLEKQILTVEEYDELGEMEEVKEIINNGNSGKYCDKMWYSVYLHNGEDFDIYL